MARDAVNKIVDAEKMAAAGISEAREQARKIMADTEKKCRAALAEAEKSAEQEAAALIAEAEAGAELNAKKILASFSDEHEKLSALAATRMDKAAALIAERVVNG